MRDLLTRFRKDQSGATAVEYGLIVACIFLAIIGAATAFGLNATDVFNTASDAIVNAGN